MAKKPARPITYNLPDDGMVTFAFIEREKAEEYIKRMKSTDPISQVKSEEKLDFGNGSGYAIGLHLNELTKEYELVKLFYDVKKNESKILEVVPSGKMAHRAYDALKIALIRNGVIK